jgi:hypothetical protein
VNVALRTPSGVIGLLKVDGVAACDATGGWYYDDEAHPTRLLLCPASCDLVRAETQRDGVSFEIAFGCTSEVK